MVKLWEWTSGGGFFCACGAIRIAIGVVAAFALTRFLASFLYGVAATDPLTFSAVVALLMMATVIASCIPAWRASRVDPISALRVS